MWGQEEEPNLESLCLSKMTVALEGSSVSLKWTETAPLLCYPMNNKGKMQWISFESRVVARLGKCRAGRALC